MKVLLISNDPSIFEQNSASRARMRSYGQAIGELHVLSVAQTGTQSTQEANLFLHPVTVPRIFRMRTIAKHARLLIQKHGIEIVSAQDPFEQGLAALKATRGTSAKLHIQVHTDFLSPWFVRSGNWRAPKVRMPVLNRLRRRIADRVLPEAAGIRVVSERIKRSLLVRYGTSIPEPVVIPVTVDTGVQEPALLPTHLFTFSLIAVGRLEPEKRLEDILSALKLVIEKYPMVGLFVVGEGREHSRLKRMVQKLHLEHSVIFLGNRTDARGLMRSANAFIQGSAYEGYGRTLIEAALAGIPIITTDVGIVGEVFKGYEHVLSVPVADPTALALSIVGLMEDNSVRQELPIRAAEAARAHLAAQGNIADRVAKNLQETCALNA